MNVYQIITDRIINELKNNNIPWKKPWNGGQAYNAVTMNCYSFLNQMLLKHPDGYLTFNQIQKLNGHLKKGSKSEIVVFWKVIKK